MQLLPTLRWVTIMCAEGYEYAMESGCISLKCNVRDKPDEEDGGEEENEEDDPILPYLGMTELDDKVALISSILAEYVGTLLLVMVGCGSCMGGDEGEASVQVDDQARVVRISLCFGLTVSTLAQTIGHVSGCHVNPAVTLAMVVGRKMGMMKGLLYAASQCLGGITGAAILSAVVLVCLSYSWIVCI